MPSETAAPAIVTAVFVIIGNEILSGRTRDANLGVLADELVRAGIRLLEVRIIPDDQAVIAATIRDVRDRHDHVFTSGGIGPTHDDITCESVADAFGLPVGYHEEAVAHMTAHAERIGIELNEARMRMARTPAGASLIINPVSAAPGFTVGNVHVMAGVPRVFEAMVKQLVPTLAGGARMLSTAITSALGEGTLAAGLGEIQARHPDIDIGSYPYFRAGAFGATLVLRGIDPDQLESAALEVETLIRSHGGEPDRMENDQDDC